MTISVSTDTIYARASGAGKAGVAVFRLSGSKSHAIANQLVGKRIKIREPKLVVLRGPSGGGVIDRGLVILFKAPASFTGEDVAEFHLHGARAVETALYEALSALGARPAEPGEFTYRALKNAKLDLAQAEALADLIDSETTIQRMQALGQLEGRLSAVAEGWRKLILEISAPLEADIDFPDEGDVPAAVAARAAPALAALKRELSAFILNSQRARIIREGVMVAIIGPPNAGKSSLVNALSGSDVAIVNEAPGTTRDIIETRLDLGGVVATLADTAGLRKAVSDDIEREGVARARMRAGVADIRMLVVDGAQCVSRETLLSGGDENVLPETLALLQPGDFLIWNKADIAGDAMREGNSGFHEHTVSAKIGAGMAELVTALTRSVAGPTAGGEGPALTRARHVKAVEDAIVALTRAEARIETAPELAAEDARLAARALGGITGAVGVEDVLGEIFSSFCVGK